MRIHNLPLLPFKAVQRGEFRPPFRPVQPVPLWPANGRTSWRSCRSLATWFDLPPAHFCRVVFSLPGLTAPARSPGGPISGGRFGGLAVGLNLPGRFHHPLILPGGSISCRSPAGSFGIAGRVLPISCRVESIRANVCRPSPSARQRASWRHWRGIGAIRRCAPISTATAILARLARKCRASPPYTYPVLAF